MREKFFGTFFIISGHLYIHIKKVCALYIKVRYGEALYKSSFTKERIENFHGRFFPSKRSLGLVTDKKVDEEN